MNYLTRDVDAVQYGELIARGRRNLLVQKTECKTIIDLGRSFFKLRKIRACIAPDLLFVEVLIFKDHVYQ